MEEQRTSYKNKKSLETVVTLSLHVSPHTVSSNISTRSVSSLEPCIVVRCDDNPVEVGQRRVGAVDHLPLHHWSDRGNAGASAGAGAGAGCGGAGSATPGADGGGGAGCGQATKASH